MWIAPSGHLRFWCHSCARGGDALGFIRLVRGLDVRRDFGTVVSLAEEIAATMPAAGSGYLRSSRFPAAALELLLHHTPLQHQHDAVAYLQHRRIYEIAVEHGWGALPADESQREELIDLVDRSVAKHERLSWALAPVLRHQRLLIPHRAPDGHVIGLQARSIDPDATARYRDIAGSDHSWPYGIARAIAQDSGSSDVVFTEGAIDALSYEAWCRTNGLDRVVVGLPSARWNSAWASLAVGREAVIAVDDDDAGRRLVETMATDLYGAGALSVVRHTFADGDVNDAWGRA